ncbi:unnamed protein product [Allacma fusca]|uniref:Cytochrome P450 n=1 Tax=Allacma fusca TaxID=39272 RepID=A0A8J2LKJ1_9HEXA|nr:unnamed protein product [Allacma fusca]
MIIFTLVFIAFLAGIVLQSLRRNENKIRRPPGPGNFCTSVLTFLRAFVHPSLGRYFTKLGKTYGPLTYVRLGPFKVILVNGTEALREVCKIPALNGRIDCMFKDIMGHQGILWTDNTSQNRKFFFRNTRHFGLGAASAENNIHEEITHLFKYFDSFGGKACSVKGAYNISTLNGIIHRFMGEKVSQDDPQLKSIVDRLHVLVEAPGIMKACIFVPSLTKWIPWSLSGRNFMEKVFRDGLDIAYPILQNRFKSRIPNQPRDLADALMDEVEETTDSNSIFHISKDPIRPLFFDMFTAAIETTIQTYTVSSETKLKSLEGSMAIGYHPPEFKVSFVRRC